MQLLTERQWLWQTLRRMEITGDSPLKHQDFRCVHKPMQNITVLFSDPMSNIQICSLLKKISHIFLEKISDIFLTSFLVSNYPCQLQRTTHCFKFGSGYCLGCFRYPRIIVLKFRPNIIIFMHQKWQFKK